MELSENKLKGIIDKSLKEIVLPRLEKIEKKQIEHDEKFGYIIEAVAETKVDITEMKEDVNDSKYTEERIETRLNSVIRNQDDINAKSRQLNRRVIRLETKRA